MRRPALVLQDRPAEEGEERTHTPTGTIRGLDDFSSHQLEKMDVASHPTGDSAEGTTGRLHVRCSITQDEARLREIVTRQETLQHGLNGSAGLRTGDSAQTQQPRRLHHLVTSLRDEMADN